LDGIRRGSINANPEQEPLIEGLKILFHPLKLRNVENFREHEILKPYTTEGKDGTSNDCLQMRNSLSS